MEEIALKVSEELYSEMKEYLLYDAENGIFTWKKKRGARGVVGGVAGSYHHNGYLVVKFSRKKYAAHRLAWLFYYGRMPDAYIDHVNGNGLDNRIENLREASKQENCHNLRKANKANKLGVLGVHWAKGHRKYKAQISFNKKVIYIGAFDCPNVAHQAYLEAKRRLHSYCTI